MAQLQDLGLLSFTPSREFKGQRINSYDDRYVHTSLRPFFPPLSKLCSACHLAVVSILFCYKIFAVQF